MENKQLVLDKLCEALQSTDAGADLIGLEYKKTDAGERAVGTFVSPASETGMRQVVANINYDSGIAIIDDVLRQMGFIDWR